MVRGGPRGAVSAFCRISPTATAQVMADLVLDTRDEFKEAGHDHGPLSVVAKLSGLGFTPPSRATVARLFSRAGVVVPESRKKPRSAYKRVVYPQPNAGWQIGSTEWLLADRTKVAVFQLIDDHSRLALASLVAGGETIAAAITVVALAIERHGVPQKFLSENGAALNPTRRGRSCALVEFPKAKGVQPITGKPYKPTTQGKNERFHQTLHKYLHGQPPAPSMGKERIGETVHVVYDHATIVFFGPQGTEIISTPGRRKEHSTSATESPQASSSTQQERAERTRAIEQAGEGSAGRRHRALQRCLDDPDEVGVGDPGGECSRRKMIRRYLLSCRWGGCGPKSPSPGMPSRARSGSPTTASS